MAEPLLLYLWAETVERFAVYGVAMLPKERVLHLLGRDRFVKQNRSRCHDLWYHGPKVCQQQTLYSSVNVKLTWWIL